MGKICAIIGAAAALASLLAFGGCRNAEEGKARYNPNVPVAFNVNQGYGNPNASKRLIMPPTP